MGRKFFVIMMLLWLSWQLSAQHHMLWQIGAKDKSAEELALSSLDYEQYGTMFGQTVLYEVGKNKPQTDFPFVLPGPGDAWAGSTSKQIYVRFGIKDMTENSTARLELDFVEVHPYIPPTLEITVNGFRSEITAPAGKDQDYLDNRKPNPATLHCEVNIPAGVLKKGSNLVSIRSTKGCWLVFDQVCLNVERQMTLTQPAAGINLMAAEVKPALVYGKNRELLQPVTLQVINWGKPQTIDVLIGGVKSKQTKLNTGVSTIEVGLPEVKTESDYTIALSAKSKIIEEIVVKAFPVKLRTVYLMQHTHTDIGYTKPQTEILAEHIRYIDYAVEYCELTENYPDDAKFRWTCEASWAVKEYILNRPKEQVDKFVKYVRAGQIEVAGMFFNMSEIVDENSFKTFFEPLRTFKELGIPVKTAVQNDVNGIAWCLADYLPDLGIKYFTMGENGHRALIPFDRPTLYKWESPSGKFLYSYRSDHYMTGNFWGIDKVDDIEKMAPAVFGYLDGLVRRGYPFDAVGVQYSGYYTDNSPPSIHECDVIRDWNDKYAVPKLRSALFHEFLDDVTARYDDRLPVIRA
ncbi:MAG: hypothetical protein LBF89_04635, partial [Bacteroidales bacterium]|nr:hypothetical protein [Bacteroidales bacterium]